MALENNLGLKIQTSVVERSFLEVDAANTAFDPELQLRGSFGDSLSPRNASTLEQTSRPFSENSDASLSVNRDIPLGATVEIGTSLDRSETNSSISSLNPEYNTSLFFNINQPLLRGAGRKVNMIPIYRAESAQGSSLLERRAAVLDLVQQVERDYYRLAYRIERKILLESSIEAARRLLKETEERKRAGLALEVDVLSAQANLAGQQEALLSEDANIADAQDALLTTLGTLQEIEADETVQPEALAIPEPQDELAVFIEAAMAQDIDQRTQQQAIARAKLSLHSARNNRLPSLNLGLSGSYRGRASDSNDAFQGTLRGDGYNWQTSLAFSMPWGMREAKAREAQARIQVYEEELQLEQVRQQLLLDLRSVWRNLQTSYARLEAAEVTLQFREKQFGREEARYSSGAATLTNVLDAQEDLDRARLSKLDARFNLLAASIDAARLDGSLLERNGFAWPESESFDPLPIYTP